MIYRLSYVCVCMCRSIFHTHLRFLYLNISIEYEFIDSFEDFIGRDKAKERRGEVSVGMADTSINFVQ